MLPNGPYSSVMDDEIRRLMRRINNARNATVVHHETCPCCGRKLVNLYRREKEWKCRLCWEAQDKEANDG